MHENPAPESCSTGCLFAITGAKLFGVAETALSLEQR